MIDPKAAYDQIVAFVKLGAICIMVLWIAVYPLATAVSRHDVHRVLYLATSLWANLAEQKVTFNGTDQQWDQHVAKTIREANQKWLKEMAKDSQSPIFKLANAVF